MKENNDKKIVILTIILFLVLLFFCMNMFDILKKKSIQAISAKDVAQAPEILVNEHPVNISKIIDENRNIDIREEMIYEEQDLEYTTRYVNNEELPSGTIHVSQIGITGSQDTITIKKYNGDDLISEQIVASNVKKASIDKVVEIGVGKGKNRYELKNGDLVYATPEFLPMMQYDDLNSEKLITIPKGTEVRVLEVLDNGWSYVYSSFREGYVLSETLSNINPIKKEQDGDNGTELSKAELLATLDYNMNVGEPSGLSLEQFRSILQGKAQDKNGIFEANADYFYYAEQEYGINGVFLASLAIHESGWGTSRISLNKKNLFGYQAYDGSAYESSKQFETYSEGIDLVARVLIKYYLNEKGTNIYSGDIADGRYFSGTTIEAVNKHYASDSGWSSSIYKIMKNLYNDL